MDRIDRALDIFGLTYSATREDIKQAYRDLAKVWHPDRFPAGSRVRAMAEEKLKEINFAYDILRGYDPASRVHFQSNDDASAGPDRNSANSNAHTQERDTQSPATKPAGETGTNPSSSSYAKSGFRRSTLIWASLVVSFLGYIAVTTQKGNLPTQTSQIYSTKEPSFNQPSAPYTILDRGKPTGLAVTVTPSDPTSEKTIPTRAAPEGQTQGSSATKNRQSHVAPEVKPKQNIARPEIPRRAVPGYITLGSTKDEVLAVQGTPTKFNDRVWEYGLSSINFNADKVVGWDVWPGAPLKVRMHPVNQTAPTKGYITIGSTKDEVLAVQGTPTKFNDRVWKYGLSSINFNADKVVGWDVWPGAPLKVHLDRSNER